MFFNLIPSLEYISIIKIVVRLWDQYEDIKQEVNFGREFYFRNDMSWLYVEEKVIRKVEMLPLPLEIRKKIIPLIKPIGFEVMKWIMFLREYISERHIMRSLDKLHWTQLGKIDRRKTAGILIRDKAIDLDTRCKLAYIYCFEFDLSVLEYKDLHLKMQSNMRCKRRFIKLFKNHDEIPDEPLVDYWTSDKGNKGFRYSYIPSRCYPNSTFYQRAFENATYNGNKAATEYFFQKLSKEEKRESLLRSAENVISFSFTDSYVSYYDYVSYAGLGSTINREYIDVFYFLFLQMDEQEQMLVLQGNAFSILTFFLNWPWQSLFIETAQYTWPYLREKEFVILLESIVGLVQKDFEYYDYRHLFTNYWNQSPKSFKNYITDNITSNITSINTSNITSIQLLYTLFKIKDEENIKLILENISLIEKKKLFFSNRAKRLWLEWIDKYNRNNLFQLLYDFVTNHDTMKGMEE